MWWEIHEKKESSNLEKKLTGIILDSEENLRRAILKVYYGGATITKLIEKKDLSEMKYELHVGKNPIGYFKEKSKARSYATNILGNQNTKIIKINYKK